MLGGTCWGLLHQPGAGCLAESIAALPLFFACLLAWIQEASPLCFDRGACHALRSVQDEEVDALDFAHNVLGLADAEADESQQEMPAAEGSEWAGNTTLAFSTVAAQ